MMNGSAMSPDLVDYYSRRAREYERIYDKPERQADLAALRAWVRCELAGHDVLEIACGTGYWTQVCAAAARSLLAVDLAEETLEIARAKEYPFGKVRFGTADAYRLEDVPGDFSAGLACFWWSHIPREQLATFLAGWHQRLGPGARVVLMDNRFVEGSSTPISRQDTNGNTYQLRKLGDGSSQEVLKNFPPPWELLEAVQNTSLEPQITEFPYYWCLSYRVRPMSRETIED
jgi:SAM-dependent methyltransferase